MRNGTNMSVFRMLIIARVWKMDWKEMKTISRKIN